MKLDGDCSEGASRFGGSRWLALESLYRHHLGMRFAGIVALTALTAICYGILHDQVTIRVSLEYFTVGHPPVFSTKSPTLLALGWGVLATWWVAFPLGFLLAAVSQNGRRYPPLSTRTVLRLIGRLLAIMALAALLSGTLGFVLANRGLLELPDALAAAVGEPNHDRYMAAWWSHGASYAVGIVGGLILIAVAWRARAS